MWGYYKQVSGGAGMISAISVKDRLKKQAIEEKKTKTWFWRNSTIIKNITISYCGCYKKEWVIWANLESREKDVEVIDKNES